MSAGEILLWVILPYLAIATFVVGTWWRYKTDQFGWTSQSTQLLEHKILGWAGPAFHYGALGAIAGHVIGMLIPASFTESLGISESAYRWISAIPGSIAYTRSGHLVLTYRSKTVTAASEGSASKKQIRRRASRSIVGSWSIMSSLKRRLTPAAWIRSANARRSTTSERLPR